MTGDPLPQRGLGGAADDLVVFSEEAAPEPSTKPPWKVAVIDDDDAVQDGTRFALYGYELDGHGLQLLSASSALEGRELLARHPDTAVILLDVVMETETAGLDLVHHIRRTLGNDLVRIILRTGQPGQAPERSVVVAYDINDYKAKTELTATKLFTSLTAALRAYQQLDRMATMQRGLERVIGATARLGAFRSLPRLAEGALAEFSGLLGADCAGLVASRDGLDPDAPLAVLAGSGRHGPEVGGGPGPTLAGELRTAVERAFAECGADFTPERTVLYMALASGAGVVVVLDCARPLSGADRALLELLCGRLAAAFDNLTLYEQIQQAQRTLEQKIEARTRQLAGANRRLREGWRRARRVKAFQSEILGTVAHDLRNPLSIVLSRVEIADELLGLTPAAVERSRSHVRLAAEATKRMATLVDTLVHAAMSEATDITIRRELGDLADLIRDVADANRPLAERKGQRIAVLVDVPLPACFDPDRLRDALDNVVSNAVKYSPLGGEIVVAARRRDGTVEIRVVDRGPGLRPEEVGLLFGQFQRLTARATGGEASSGLGLFSARRILDLHGGTIAAHSDGPGLGTTFTISLPGDLPWRSSQRGLDPSPPRCGCGSRRGGRRRPSPFSSRRDRLRRKGSGRTG